MTFSFTAISQDRTEKDLATLTVTAVDGFGSPLSNVQIDSFINEEGSDRRALFHGGQTARGVPYGKYRVTAHADGGYRNSTFVIDVASPDIGVKAGLEWYGVENSRITGILRGNLAGFPQDWDNWWCEASAVYLRLEYDSTVTPADLRFDFGEVPPGNYVLTCVADQKFFVTRTIRIAADAAPFAITYDSNTDKQAVKH